METQELTKLVEKDDYVVLSDSDDICVSSVLEIDWHPGKPDHQHVRMTGVAMKCFFNALQRSGDGDAVTRLIFEDSEMHAVVAGTPGFSILH